LQPVKGYTDKEGDFMSNFVICINNKDNPASLILGKVYLTLSDAAEHNMVRVIDEDKSESDGYLYEASMFAQIELPETVRLALQQRGQL
jgi:hypothetical protein